MEGITLQLRLDGESAELFTKQLLAFAEKQVREKLERKGLRFRKQGKDIMYDVNDVYEILELEKQVRKLRA